jgi:hypothetical protein
MITISVRSLLMVVFLLELFSCSSNDSGNKNHIENSTTEPDSFALPEPQFVANDQKEILFATDTLYKGDTLKIKFKTPHVKDLAITTPDNKFFFVVYGLNDTTMPSLVDWHAFANIDHLEIITDKTKVNPWDARIHENQLVFTKTGTYEIRFSENLETDDGTPVEVEAVYYFHEERKNK